MQPQEALEPIYSPGDRDKAVYRIAQIATAARIGTALSYDAMRELINFQLSDDWKALGYTRWVDFLEHSQISPMTATQYYDRKKVFEKENSMVWDKLTDKGIPLYLRQRLPAGSVEVTDTSIVIRNGDGETTSFSLAEANRTQIIETVKTLVSSLEEKTKTIEQGRADIRKWKERALDAEDNPSAAAGSAVTDFDKAHMAACGILSALAEEIDKLRPEACQAYLDGSFNLLAIQYQQVNNALCDKLELETLD